MSLKIVLDEKKNPILSLLNVFPHFVSIFGWVWVLGGCVGWGLSVRLGWAKNCWSTFFGPQFFFGQHFFGKHFFRPKQIWPKKIVSQKQIWTPKHFGKKRN
jgi:hypothetical protein